MMKKKHLYQAGALACLLLIGASEADASIKRYNAKSDAGAEVLDYIENERRQKRANQMTEDQLQLRDDVAQMEKSLQRPVQQGEKQPISVEGDDMYYDQQTGAVYARGNVRVTELDAKRVITDRVDGNIKTTIYKAEDLAHMLQLTPGMPPLTADGYQLIYNFTDKTGTMENVRGKNGQKYFYAKHMEFYPEKVVLYDGWQSDCGAESPHYRMSAKSIELFQDYMVIHKAKYYLGAVCVYGKEEVVKTYEESDEKFFPNLDWDSDNGLEIGYDIERNIAKNTKVYADLLYITGNHRDINGWNGFKNIYGANWSNGGNSVTVETGWYADGSNRWLRKTPTFKYSYGNRIGKLPLRYSLSYENGRWSQERDNKKIKSRHKSYGASLSHDPIYLFGKHTWLNLSTGYSITDESYDDSRVKGWSYDGTLFREFGKKLVLFTGYHYSAYNSTNSVFDYDLDSYSRKLNYGFSLQLGKHDRFVMANEMNMESHSREEVEYFWFHDFHCMTGILKYTERHDSNRDNSIKLKLQFAPW